MKRLLLLMSVVLSAGMFYACSSDDEMEGFANKDLVGSWELKRINKGWSEPIIFGSNKVTCEIYDTNVLVLRNTTDTDLSPFVNTGTYDFKLYSKEVVFIADDIVLENDRRFTINVFSINGNEFEIFIDKEGVLHLNHGIEYDGESYLFTRIR